MESHSIHLQKNPIQKSIAYIIIILLRIAIQNLDKKINHSYETIFIHDNLSILDLSFF